MIIPPREKYRPYKSMFKVSLPDRTWPERDITQAPLWCSVDLRDGNQALKNPMSLEKKLELFRVLVQIGFREIEIGFPSASEVEFQFARALIDEHLLPDTVIPQVLTQARTHLIDKTFESLKGAKRAIVHLYNSTSELQRRVVFKKEKKEILDIALQGTERVKCLAEQQTDTDIIFQYSPESFTGTELDYALEVCNSVIDLWDPTPQKKLILNLPATVEMSLPNVYADQIEWFCRNLKRRDSVVVSVHPHNDRGTGVAATELALLAGADRVEGTLFGNGERTGNVDIVTLALNMYTQGVDPQLDLHSLKKIVEVYECCTEMTVHPRHPYAGDLVFTAFSGSHQDAINKGLREREVNQQRLWEVPYLTIDPGDIGRQYDPIIRINSQSGKGGTAFIMHSEFGCDLPKDMHPEFGAVVQKVTDRVGTEITALEVWQVFSSEYLDLKTPIELLDYTTKALSEECDQVTGVLRVRFEGEERILSGTGNGPIDACLKALLQLGIPQFRIKNFWQHARSAGSDAEAISYVQVESSAGRLKFGVGIHSSTQRASVKALISAVNRLNSI
jgi:2-isopropylmalate synthase